jgi:hypothetical protein
VVLAKFKSAQDDAEHAADRADNGHDPHRPEGTLRRCGQ